MGGRIYLYIGSYQDTVPYIYPVIIHERTVHIDDDPVSYENVPSVLAMEINIHMHGIAHTADQLAQDSFPFARIGIIRRIEPRQQAFGLLCHGRQLRNRTVERFAGHTLLIFRLHFIYCPICIPLPGTNYPSDSLFFTGLA